MGTTPCKVCADRAWGAGWGGGAGHARAVWRASTLGAATGFSPFRQLPPDAQPLMVDFSGGCREVLQQHHRPNKHDRSFAAGDARANTGREV